MGLFPTKMFRLGLVAVLGAFSLLAQAEETTLSHTFDGGPLPDGWRFEGQGIAVQNGRFELGAVDVSHDRATFGSIVFGGALPTGLTELRIQYDTNRAAIDPLFYGMGTDLRVYNDNGARFEVIGYRATPYAADPMFNAYMYTDRPGSDAIFAQLHSWARFSPQYGDYTITNILRDGQVSLSVQQKDGPFSFETGFRTSTGFSLASISRIELQGVASDGVTRTWVDNVSVTVTAPLPEVPPPPVPEPETYAMLLAGLGLVSIAARKSKGRRV